MKQLVTSLVLSRIDYCNVVLVGLPASTIAPLQRVQNAAARLVLRLDRRSHITPALRELHWLPVKYRVMFKVAVFMHQVTAQRCPSYVADLVAFSTPDSQRQSLQLSSDVHVRNSDDVRPRSAARTSGIICHRRYAPLLLTLHSVVRWRPIFYNLAFSS